MSKPIIGLDFGNYNSFPCFISDFDMNTKMGGTVHDLMPAKCRYGIPSVYFYSAKLGVMYGEDAMQRRAKPIANRLRYLKRHLGETAVLDGKTVSYDEAITEVIQHCVRIANKELQSGYQMTTNKISLSYPATYTCAQRQRLIELAEKAKLEDGTTVSVFGTISEPAAAALDYLAEHARSDKETTVLTYDLGGGTFDLALVSVYPKGRKNANGGIYYYDIINARGLGKLGGKEFDEIVFELIKSKLDDELTTTELAALREEAENVKIALTTNTAAEPNFMHDGDYLGVEVTREEFERKARPLLMQTIDATRAILNDHPNQQPEFILITGGSCEMPMVERELSAALPQFKGRIIKHRPSRAIAYGAARYGAEEINRDPAVNSAVVQRTMYDIGVRFFNDANDRAGYIETYIPAGTQIPFYGEYRASYTLHEKQRYSGFSVCEANGSHPDPNKVERDYTEIMKVVIDHGRGVPIGTKSESRLNVDKRGVITIDAHDPKNKKKSAITHSVELKNLS